MKKKLGIIATVLALFGCGEKDSDLKAVEFVDAEKYIGKWYDVASFP